MIGHHFVRSFKHSSVNQTLLAWRFSDWKIKQWMIHTIKKTNKKKKQYHPHETHKYTSGKTETSRLRKLYLVDKHLNNWKAINNAFLHQGVSCNKNAQYKVKKSKNTCQNTSSQHPFWLTKKPIRSRILLSWVLFPLIEGSAKMSAYSQQVRGFLLLLHTITHVQIFCDWFY